MGRGGSSGALKNGRERTRCVGPTTRAVKLRWRDRIWDRRDGN